MTKIRIAIAALVLSVTAAIAFEASAGTCYTNCYGNSCTTRCY